MKHSLFNFFIRKDDGNQLGISDEELKESLRNLKFMADQVGCEMVVKQVYIDI